jgi:hypothetical protein
MPSFFVPFADASEQAARVGRIYFDKFPAHA